jgi:hypothetical protein
VLLMMSEGGRALSRPGRWGSEGRMPKGLKDDELGRVFRTYHAWEEAAMRQGASPLYTPRRHTTHTDTHSACREENKRRLATISGHITLGRELTHGTDLIASLAELSEGD